MKLDPRAPASGPVVQGFAGAGFRIDGRLFPDGALLASDWAVPWPAPLIGRLALADLTSLFADATSPEFLLLGTGAALVRPPPALVAALDARGIGVEAMDSRAAARAWGVLRGEGRVIVGALLPLR